MALVTQPGGHTQPPIKGAARVRLIQPAHDVQILHALVHWLGGQACAVHPEPLALPPHADPLVMRLNPLPPLVKGAIQLVC